MITLGVVSDTHIPDRMRALPPGLPAALAGVDLILHTGDVCAQRVLDELGRIAPVIAVKGNRDWFLRLPQDRLLEYEGVRLGLTHGHCGWLGYLREKALYYTVGFYLPRYLKQVRARFQAVDVIVFGHSHRVINTRLDGVLMFSPGSVGPDYRGPYFGPVAGRLTLDRGTIAAEVLPLEAAAPAPA
jgi:putative phosphoesterase